MDKRLEQLLDEALLHRATDIQFTITDEGISITLKSVGYMIEINSISDDAKLFNYLKYRAHLDISAINKPQSGSFEYYYDGVYYNLRFAVLMTPKMKNGVLRILNQCNDFPIERLTIEKGITDTFKRWLSYRSGLLLFTGLTGSGKTTTMYSLLREVQNRSIYSLEDPIEIVQNNMVQLEINEKAGFSYSDGIRQILRHNPDIIMIGEIRDEMTAKMTVRAALTGCLVVSSLHAANVCSAINRLLELGVNKTDLKMSLAGISNQCLVKMKSSNEFTAIFDILENQRLIDALEGNTYMIDNHKLKLEYARNKGLIV